MFRQITVSISKPTSQHEFSFLTIDLYQKSFAGSNTRLIAGETALVQQWVEYDWNFHHTAISAYDMPLLMLTHRNIFERYLRYHMLTLAFRGDAVRRDHDRLSRLIVSRDTAQALDLLTRHIHSGRDYVIASGKVPQ